MWCAFRLTFILRVCFAVWPLVSHQPMAKSGRFGDRFLSSDIQSAYDNYIETEAYVNTVLMTGIHSNLRGGWTDVLFLLNNWHFFRSSESSLQSFSFKVYMVLILVKLCLFMPLSFLSVTFFLS